ncbi:MAG: oligopeptide transport system substrate-binding protein [Actinomycetota bacterium]|jgi:oligopeptide transport system substrate-binding protein|nr:oligopeptide transport system substrate-binding protein [Actinomycetota bacterium]MDQ1664262.1 oligopeptide transport system substrate-binding protein [Actinomycetota bacterium]MDQ1669251.1 oligopeptide transport system substrate-binding protein [Actinomycetota bacterium]
MRGLSRAARAVAGAATIALVATACGGGSGDSGGSSPSAAGKTGGAITYGSCKPQNNLIPANSNEVCGGRVIDALFTGLVDYNSDDASPQNAVAESIESTDNKLWTIKLKTGWTFHDGTPVDAASFVDAWNYSAYGPNAMQNSYFFGPIDGFTDVQGEDKNKDEKIEASEAPIKEMKGLKVVDDSTFEVTLSTPSSVFPVMVGYTAFSPLPKSFFDDPKAFGDKPVGNGAFKLDSGDGDTGYTLSAYKDYKGAKPKIDKLTFKTYQTPEAEYADLLADNLDFIDQVPPSALAGDQYKQDLGDRQIDKAVGVIQTATVPIYDSKYKSPDLAKAISLAINREQIVKQIYNNGRQPATGWVSPVVNGYKAGACGEFCTFDAAKAKEFLQKAGGFTGTMTYGYNADGPGNKEAAEAICGSISNALGVKCQAKAYVDFNTLRTDVDERKMTGLFRTGWVMDYPSIENFLVPLYSTGASSNDNDQSIPQFDALVKEAAAADTTEAANAKYEEAEKLLATTMAVIPLWYSNQQSGWSSKVSNVKVNPFGNLDLESVTVK